MKRFTLLVLVLAAGCLGPRADSSAFFMLSPVPPPAAEAPVAVRMGLGPITIPGYLDRLQMVERVSDNEVAVSEVDRWVEPLDGAVARTLEANLAGLLPGSSYVAFPWYPSEAPDLAVSVEFRRFEADVAGAVALEATWRLTRGAAEVERRATRIAVQADAPGRAAAVAAQSRALAQLSAEIAAAVRRAGG